MYHTVKSFIKNMFFKPGIRLLCNKQADGFLLPCSHHSPVNSGTMIFSPDERLAFPYPAFLMSLKLSLSVHLLHGDIVAPPYVPSPYLQSFIPGRACEIAAFLPGCPRVSST